MARLGAHVEPGIAVRDLGDVQLATIVKKVVCFRASQVATDADVLGINDREHIDDVVMDEVLLEKLDLLLKASNCRKQFIGRVVLDRA